MTEQVDRSVELAAWFQAHSLPEAPSWFRPVRQAAMERFDELGVPGVEHEDWRFTNTAAIQRTRFQLPQNDTAQVSPQDVEAAGIPDLNGGRLVFVNGRFSGPLSRLTSWPRGVKVLSLAEAFDSEQAALRKHLGQVAGYEDQAFTALNTALAQDGVVVLVADGVQVDEPIHVLNLAAGDGQPLLTNPRNLIVAGANASVAIVEDYVSLGAGAHLTNAVTEVVVGDNAQVTHYLIERENSEAFNISSLHARQGRDSRFTSHSVLLGGAIVRNNVNPILDGPGSDSLLNGLYVIGGQQTVDNHMRVIHAKAHGDSRQYYKGIMSGRARGVFRGRIIVRPGAQKIDAKQSNENLLLSDSASVNTDPQLEIYADDVKCTHGATIGQINQDQVFYLRSRGIPEQVARSMLVYAFAGESVDRITHEPIRRFLRSQVLDRLPAHDRGDRRM